MISSQQIRKQIQRADNNELTKDEIYDLLIEIEDFKDIYRHLPQDIADWYDETTDFIYQYNEALAGDWEG